MRTFPLLCVLLSACSSGKLLLSDLEDAGDIEEACSEYEPEEITLEVVFPAQTDACSWGKGDNLEPANGYFTARVEEVVALEMPEDAVICDMSFAFSGIVPGDIQVMVYDDHFFFTFNDIVLAASYGPAVEALEETDGLRQYAWEPIAGMEYHTEDSYSSYCLGEDEGEATCDIPDTEVEGEISLSYSDSIVSELSLRAIEDERYDFSFITTGDDNPNSDCMHEEFSFTVDVPYLQL